MRISQFILAIILLQAFALQASYAHDLPYAVISIECTHGDTTLDFRWDLSRSAWIPHIYLNGNLETGGTNLKGDHYEKEGKFSISLRRTDDQVQFKKSAMIFDQYVELQCTQKEEWFDNGCDAALTQTFKNLRKMMKGND